MNNTGLRFNANAIPYDAFNNKAKYVNFGVGASEARFISGNASAKFLHNTYVANAQTDFNTAFPGVFTVSFWAKFPAGGLGDSIISDNVFFIILDGGTKISYTLSSYDNNWHHYSIVRDNNDDIILRIDGITVATGNSDEVFDLANSSVIGLGTYQRHFTGYDVIADDIVIVSGILWKSDFGSDLPSDYIDLSNYRQFLYIITSTGEVWGYAD